MHRDRAYRPRLPAVVIPSTTFPAFSVYESVGYAAQHAIVRSQSYTAHLRVHIARDGGLQLQQEAAVQIKRPAARICPDWRHA